MESKKKNSNMNKTWLLIAVLIVLTAVLLVLSVYYQEDSSPSPTPTPEPVVEELTYATLKISDSPRVSSESGRYEVDVLLDTDENEVTVVQLEMEYDPNTIRIIAINPGELIPQPDIIAEEVDTENGTIKYWIAVSDEGSWVTGSDSVATLVFTKTGNKESEISFRPKTSINSRGVTESVLRDMMPGIIGELPTPSPTPTITQTIPTITPIQDAN